MSKVAIVGGGAAGMLCGVYAARRGHQVHILEKNEKLGKKLFITGKGRCNVTNDSDTEPPPNCVIRSLEHCSKQFPSLHLFAVFYQL